MTVFSYRAYTKSGDLSEGEIEAPGLEEASEALWLRGLTAFETRESAAENHETPWWRREIFSSQGVKPADMASFTREFAILEQAEVAIDDGLRILSEQGSSPAMRRLAKDLLKNILAGATLSDALRSRPEAFSEEYVNMARAGEMDGDLGRVLSDIAALLENRVEIQSKLRTALIYPAILIVMALASVAVVIGVLIPSIAPILSEGGHHPPAGLEFLIEIQHNWPRLVIEAATGSAVLALSVRVALARPTLRLRFDRFLLRTPVIGVFLAKMDCARFARTLGALMRARVSLLSALASARAVVLNRHIKESLGGVIESVRDGDSLTRALALVEVWPAIVTRMVSVGEEAGKLDHMLLRLADMFAQQTQRQIDRGMSLVTPLLTILISVLVGGLIYTVMSAVLSINELAIR
ncbi:MAG TPA: type II secretion system F family protein [Beijerinckiaceae bacterium]|nr:type II secretion system F family protein [Beijerinckiaceae bacterium]